MKVKHLILAAVIAISACGSKAHPPSVGLMAAPPPSGKVIGYDPSVVGLPGAIGDTVYDSGGIISWLKFGTSNTAWRPVPVSQLVTGDPSQAPGLKAQIGFVVTLNDGSKSWIKSTSSDTGWVVNPGGGGSGSGIVDGGVISPLAGVGSLANPLHIIDGGIQDPASVSITGGSISGTTINGNSSAKQIATQAYLDTSEGWKKKQFATMIAAIPALTGFGAMYIGSNPAGAAIGAPSGEATVEGGGLTNNGAALVLGVSIFQNLPGGNWAFCYRAQVTALTSGKFGQVGIESNAGPGTDFYFFGYNFASDTTHFILGIHGAGATTVVLNVADMLWHDNCVTDDGTTVKAWQDGTMVGSTVTRTNLVAGAMQPYFLSSATSILNVSRFAWGYVQP